jgi:serine/threonine-protein kinase RsbW
MLFRISLDLPDAAETVPLCRTVLRQVLRELSVEETRADEIEMALGEAAANVIRHAYAEPGNRYLVTVEFLNDRIRLQVRDEGSGFVRADVPDPEDAQVGGWGIWLIERMASVATIRALPDGGCLLEADFTLARPITISSAPSLPGPPEPHPGP